MVKKYKPKPQTLKETGRWRISKEAKALLEKKKSEAKNVK